MDFTIIKRKVVDLIVVEQLNLLTTILVNSINIIDSLDYQYQRKSFGSRALNLLLNSS